jgi:hypothetical protein
MDQIRWPSILAVQRRVGPRGAVRQARVRPMMLGTWSVQVIRGWAEQTLLWSVWDRMLETEFIDRRIALAGKAFISFFPLIIVIAAFPTSHLRSSILTTVTRRLGITGPSLATVQQAFASAQDIRRATGLLGLVLAVFYASSFTTALRRAYLRAWRRPHAKAVGNYVLGSPGWRHSSSTWRCWVARATSYGTLWGLPHSS